MASSSRSGGRNLRTLKYDPNPADQPHIDARATRRDIDGNVIPEPGMKTFTDIHRGMGGELLSGKDVRTGAATQFPQPGHDALPGMDRPSAMTSGNRHVAFQGVDQRAQALHDAAGERAGQVSDAVRRIAAGPGGIPGFPAAPASAVHELSQDEAGRTTGYVAQRGDGSRDLTSVYGGGTATPGRGTTPASETGAGRFPKPSAPPPGPRIADETGDRTADFVPGGRFSSAPAPKPPGTPPSGVAGPSGSSGPAGPTLPPFPKPPAAVAPAAARDPLDAIGPAKAPAFPTLGDGPGVRLVRDPVTGYRRPALQTGGPGNGPGFPKPPAAPAAPSPSANPAPAPKPPQPPKPRAQSSGAPDDD